ncbi:MAG TPA: 3-hydroxybutyryl-CoA dehydrogenase [Haliangiales bacterium]|nr:3-hydroxybutyryl-CoA dehydrogenase [Haliangiales bacterium]
MDVKTLGVIGTGQMGAGIAQVAAQSGLDVIMLDASLDLANKAKARLADTLGKLVAKGKLDAAARERTMERLHPAADYAALAPCEFVVEAAPETEALKVKIFHELDRSTRPDAVLASNTSSISITKLGSHTKRPDKVIGMHFMNPVPLMKLVEVVRGLPTSEQTFQTTVKLAEKFGKTTIAARDIPGFIVNRVLIPLLNEACYALYEGLGTVEDIDKGVKMGLNHPMGPLELADLIGLDTCLAIAEVLHNELGDDKYRPCPLLRQYVAAGWYGRKVGRGFYTYT